jgi:hypothetical protein
MGDWRTDRDLDVAARDLADTFTWMLDDELPASGYPKEQIDGIYRDKDIFESLDPQKLYDEYERIYKAALAVGDNYDAVAEFRQSGRYLANWTGSAADEFKMQLDKMEIFCDEQQTRILRGLLGVTAVYAVAVEGRESFYSLLRAARAAGINAKEQQRKEDAKLKSALLFDLAGGILGRDPGNLLGSAVVTAVDMGKDISERIIEGNDADQVMNNYRQEADRLCQSFGMSLDRVTKDLNDQLSDAAKPAEFFKPLPTVCDVDSPDFRYENFHDNVNDPGPIGPRVEEERQKYVEEKHARQQQESEIDRRLNHGDKGAI